MFKKRCAEKDNLLRSYCALTDFLHPDTFLHSDSVKVVSASVFQEGCSRCYQNKDAVDIHHGHFWRQQICDEPTACVIAQPRMHSAPSV